MTPKQQRFIDEYLIDLNATRAAVRAGYSEDSAKEIGCQNLTKLNIKEAIQERQKELSIKHEFNQGKARQMYMDVYEIAKDNNNPNAMNSAVAGLCKLYGVNSPDKSEVTNKGVIPVTSAVTFVGK